VVTVDGPIVSAGSETLLDEDFAFSELLDKAELLDTAEPFDLTLLLDFLSVLELDEGPEPSWLSPLRMTLDEESFPSSGRVAKSLSSSPQAASIIVPTRIPSQKYRIFSPKLNLIIDKKIPEQVGDNIPSQG
jgi:hypothetical protein